MCLVVLLACVAAIAVAFALGPFAINSFKFLQQKSWNAKYRDAWSHYDTILDWDVWSAFESAGAVALTIVAFVIACVVLCWACGCIWRSSTSALVGRSGDRRASPYSYELEDL